MYTPSGEQIGISDVGEGDNRLTFPRLYLVGDALHPGVEWIRFATAAELEIDNKWWRKSEFQPSHLYHCVGLSQPYVAPPEDFMGLFGDRMEAKRTIVWQIVTEKPKQDALVDGISTPPSPPMRL